MRRLLVLLLLFVAVAALAVPAGIGWLLASRAPALAAGGGPAIGAYRLGDLRVDRGWFTSELTATLSADAGPPVEVRSRIVHGPWAGPLGWLGGRFEAIHGGRPLLDGDFAVSAFGNLCGSLRPAAELGSGRLRFAVRDLGKRFSLVSEALAVAPWVQSLSGDASWVRSESGARWNLRAEVDRVSDGTREIRGLRITHEAVQAGASLALDLDIAAASMTDDGDPWRELVLGVRFERLHAPTLSSLLRGLREAARRPGPPSVRQDAAIGLAFTALPALLLHQPAIPRLALAAEAPVGAASLSGSARLTAPPPSGFLTDFSRVLTVLEFDGSFEADAGIVEAAVAERIRSEEYWLPDDTALAQRRTEVLAHYLEEGWLVRRGDGYRSEFRFEAPLLRVNGYERPLRSFASQ